MTEFKKMDIITFSKKKDEVRGGKMRKILSMKNLKFNIFLVDILSNFSFDNIFILKFINFYS